MGKFSRWLGKELSLYVRQVAWLNAVPKDDSRKALSEGEIKVEPKSRLETILEQGAVPQYPDNPAPWLTDILMDMGPAEATGAGQVRLSWQTLRHWQDQNGVELEPGEARLLRRLSGEYITESQRAADKNAPPPVSEMTREDRRRIVAAKIDAALSAMAAAPPADAAKRKHKRKRK